MGPADENHPGVIKTMNSDFYQGDDVYRTVRWNNQFKALTVLPTYLQDEIEKHKLVLARGGNTKVIGENNPLSLALVKAQDTSKQNVILPEKTTSTEMVSPLPTSVLERHRILASQKPKWHAPWKLSKVINGHLGWVQTICIDPVANEWFATGSNDATIKIWGLASGKLKLTLSGHAMTVRDVVVSSRHSYLFSASEDKLVKCWDLERNTAIRDYFGHLSAVQTVTVHPTLDLIVSGGRDNVIKLWDIRSRQAVLTLVGHKGQVNKVRCLPVDPQVVSCSTDSTLRLWDIVAGKAMKVITHHRKNVRDIALHPSEFSMTSASAGDIKSWMLPSGSLLTNFESKSLGTINTLSTNEDDVLFAGGDDGSISFFDYRSGHLYQKVYTRIMPGSSESERGVLCSTFDRTGTRLLTGETDKSIKIWKQVEDATHFTDPGLPWNPTITSQRL